MPNERRSEIEKALDPDDRKKVERILSYSETAVARLMTPKVWWAPRSVTVGEALARLRADHAEIEVAQNCYVVEDDKLVGVVPLREMVVRDSSAPVEQIIPSPSTKRRIAPMPPRSSRRTTFFRCLSSTKPESSWAPCAWTICSTPRSRRSAPGS
jgi:CBS domain containing-hemolysin-like protein